MVETAYKNNAREYGLNGPPEGTPERAEWLNSKPGQNAAKLTDPNNPDYKDAQKTVKDAGQAAYDKSIADGKAIAEKYHQTYYPEMNVGAAETVQER